jgi:hypothetical protein
LCNEIKSVIRPPMWVGIIANAYLTHNQGAVSA